MEGYFKQLELALRDLPEEDRKEAILYYKDYVFDASVTEDNIEEILGTPEELARNIRQELFGSNQDTILNRKVPVPYRNTEQHMGADAGRKSKRKRTTLETVLIILLLIVTFPFWIGIVGAVGGILFALLIVVTVVPASLIFAAGVVGICFVGTGLLLFIVAIMKLFVTPILAVVPMGIALLLFGVGVLLIFGVGYLLFKMLPWLIKGFVRACRKCLRAIKGIF